MAQQFKVEIEETLCKSFKVKAKTAQQAIQKIKAQYYKEKIVLDADDCIGVVFSAEQVENKLIQ